LSSGQHPLNQSLSSFPELPGIYKMLDGNSRVIYVGKAKHLRKRLASYFVPNVHDDLKTRVMLTHVDSVETVICQSEQEALILERQLIQALSPKYNILLKDDKSYPYLCVTTGDVFPRIVVTRQRVRDAHQYFGPYPSIGSTRKLQRMLYELFPLRDCKQEITLENVQPKCMLLDIEKCVGPCVNKDIKDDYDQMLQSLLMLLSGKNKAVLRRMTQEMRAHANAQRFEQAAKFRDRIQKIEQLGAPQHVHLPSMESLVVWVAVHNDDFDYILVQEFFEGRFLYQHGYYQERGGDWTDFVERSVVSFFEWSQNQGCPILCEADLKGTIESVLVAMEVPQRQVHVPQRGTKAQLCRLAQKNAMVALTRLKKMKAPFESNQRILMHLQDTCQLRRYPSSIIGIDISHLGGTHMVGSAVYFRDGATYKPGYRRFQIRTVSTQSHDPLAIQETCRRRLRMCMDSEEGLPDLILIDGGIAQLNFAYEVLKEMGIADQVDMLSIAKKEELLYHPFRKYPYRFAHHDIGLRLLQSVRDESHRFALAYHRLKRGKMFFDLDS